MAVNVWSSIEDHSIYVLIFAISATSITIIMSTMYLIRKLFKFRGVNNNSDDVKRKLDNDCQSDKASNDGDRHCDMEDDDVTVTKETLDSTHQHLSPRYADPVEYCEHIQGEFKRVQQSVATRTIKKSLTDQQLEEEREVQRRQLEEIFRLMQEQQDRFGIGSVDDMQEQMKLYAL